MNNQYKYHLERRQSFLAPGLVSLILILILSAGYLYYRYQKNAILQEKYTDLKMIADLKVQQIVYWREERLANAQIITESPFFRQKIVDWLLSKDKTVEKDLFKQFLLTKSEYNYEDIFLVSAEGELLLGHNTALKNIDTLTFNLCGKALQDGRIFISELYFCPAHNTIHLDIVAPVRNDKNVPVVVLVLRINPFDFLFPYIQTWPTSSKTAETLILRKEGDSIVYVNELRHISNTALKLRIPLSKIEVPAVKAVLGHEGIWEGPDYRGVKVLADMRPVPGTSWFMIAKVDQDEIYAELKYITVTIIIITLLLLLFFGIGISWLYNNRQKNIYRKLFETGNALQDTQEEFRTTLYSIGDAVITTDTKGCIRIMNAVAEKLTGWTEPDAVGKTIEEVFNIINEESRNKVESPVLRVLKEGLVVGLANHTVLISNDGKETPIADSGAPIRNEKGDITGVVLVFRDQVRELMAQEALRESIRLNSSIMYAAQDIIVLKDNHYIFRLVNPAMCNLLGKTESEIIGKTDFDLFPYELAIKYRNDDQSVIENGHPFSFEEEVSSHEGIRYVSTIKTPVLDENNVCQGIVVITRDITERKRMEESLRRSEKDLMESQRIAHVGSWRLDVATNQVVWTEELYHMFGYDPSLPPPPYTEHMKLFAPESWERLSVALAHTRETGIPYTLELEIVRKDGSNGWVWVRGEADVDSAGKIVSLWGAVQDITGRKRAEDALRESEQFTRMVLDNLPVGIAVNSVDPDVVFNYMNDRFPEIYGTTRQALAKKDSFWEAVYEDPGFREKIRKRVLNDCESGDPKQMSWEDIPLISNGREISYVSARNIPIPGKKLAISMVWDVSERVQAIKELEQHRNRLEQLVAYRTAELKLSEEKFRTVADFAYDWEYWIDANNRMLYVSPSCERITGFLPASFYEDPEFIETIVHPDDRLVYENHIKSFQEGNTKHEKIELEFRIIAKNGCTKWIGHLCTPVTSDNRVYMGRRASNRDITETKKAQIEIEELNETLTKRKNELEASNKELEAFSYSVSHDLRAPLRHVSGYVELLNKQFQPDLPEKGRHYLNSITDAVHVMGALIDDLLQFSRTGRMEMRQSDCDMDKTVNEVIGLLRNHNPDRKIDWVVGKLASIKGDKTMLMLVWTNLLSNAVKFTGTRKKARIEIGAHKEENETVFFVRDNGVGFDMQYAQRLFGVFQRLHPVEEFEGTGIGLANVQRIVLRHGGRVWAEAEPDKGATFFFSMPNRE